MVTIVLKVQAAPGNIDKYSNVSAIGAQNTNTGTHSTDLTNATTGLNAAAFALIAYTDDNGSAQSRVISASDVKTVV